MARKVRKRRTKQAQKATIAWKKLRFPGEASHYWLVVVAMIWGCILLALTGWLLSGREYWQWVYLGAWPIGALLIVNFIADRPRRQQIKALGPHCWVRANNHPAVHRALTEACQRLEVHRLPRVCLVEDPDAYIYAMPGGTGTIVVTSPLVKLLRPEELAVMLAREVTHIKFGHLRLQRAISYIRTAPLALCFLFGPVWLWATMMGEWMDITEYTADRGALVVAGDPRRVDATIAKAAAAADRQAGVTPEEVDDYVNLPAKDSLDSAEMEQRFKLDRFINAQPNLRERIAQVVEYYQSEDGAEFLNALAERQGRPPMRVPPKQESSVEVKPGDKHWASND